MERYRGVIIEESLADKKVLTSVKILSTRISKVQEKHQTPWLKKWTLHDIEVTPDIAKFVADEISTCLESEHPWYADFNNGKVHYIIFPQKVFKVDMNDEEQYAEAKAYGISLGIPDYQVDFHPKDTKSI